MLPFTREIKYVNENIGKLIMGQVLVRNDLQKCSTYVMFEQRPVLEKIMFKIPVFGVTPTDTTDRFNTTKNVHKFLNWIEVEASCGPRNGNDFISL